MFDDLISLVGGWYADYVRSIKVILEMGDIENPILPEINYAFIPWEHIIAAVILVTFIICVFKFMRTVLCKIL